MEQTYTFWFACVRHDTVPAYLKKLEQYIDASASYVCGMETAKGVHHATNGEHIHMAAQIDAPTFKRFHLNYHVGQLKLKLKAADGIAKQYGEIKKEKIRDQLKFLAYTVKDNNIIYKNIDLKTIQTYIDVSFPKTETWENDIIEWLKVTYDPHALFTPVLKHTNGVEYWNETTKIEHLIIQYYITNSKKKSIPVRNTIRRMVSRYLMYEIPECSGPRLTHIINNYIL